MRFAPLKEEEEEEENRTRNADATQAIRDMDIAGPSSIARP